MYELLKRLFLVVSVAIATICGYLLCLDRLGDPALNTLTSQIMAATLILPIIAVAWEAGDDSKSQKLLTVIGTIAFLSLVGCWIYASGGSISTLVSEIGIALNLLFSVIVCLVLAVAFSAGVFLRRLTDGLFHPRSTT